MVALLDQILQIAGLSLMIVILTSIIPIVLITTYRILIGEY
jgi:hypothetical protein